jgi:glutamate synthase (NADPH/NADH) small chain
MGKPTGFMEYERELPTRRLPGKRVNDWFEIYQEFPQEKLHTQGARCMDCGVPFCHSSCPLNNLIPDWNDFVFRGRWQQAVRQLHATNNFPEFTGRICPAPCEAGCVLGINKNPVTIRNIEKEIVERGWREGWIVPQPPATLTGKNVAIVGSGPAGLAAAQQLARAGHTVTVFEKSDRVGGLMQYGIPNFKLEKHLLDRRTEQMEAEGVKFRTRSHVGGNVPVADLQRDFDAIILAGGAEHPRDLNIPGRELKGIHFAVPFLTQATKRFYGEKIAKQEEVTAAGRHVVIIGGGDTGADCLGTSHRQHAASITQLEIMPLPPNERSPLTPWPLWPLQLRIESSHEEGGERKWSVNTTKFVGNKYGRVQELHVTQVGPPPKFEPIPGTEFVLKSDLVLLALGFLGPVKNGMIEELGVELDARGNVKTNDQHMTSAPGVFAAGDMRRGQSLVVWAIAEGRRTALAVDRYLKTGATQ